MRMKVAKHAFSARNEDELSFAIGDKIMVTQAPAGGWWQGALESSNASGWFPCNHIEVSETLAVPARSVTDAGTETSAAGGAGKPLSAEDDERSDVTAATVFVCPSSQCHKILSLFFYTYVDNLTLAGGARVVCGPQRRRTFFSPRRRDSRAAAAGWRLVGRRSCRCCGLVPKQPCRASTAIIPVFSGCGGGGEKATTAAAAARPCKGQCGYIYNQVDQETCWLECI